MQSEVDFADARQSRGAKPRHVLQHIVLKSMVSHTSPLLLERKNCNQHHPIILFSEEVGSALLRIRPGVVTHVPSEFSRTCPTTYDIFVHVLREIPYYF